LTRSRLLPHLPNGRQVVIPDIGHTDNFWTYEPSASKRLINTYFDSGRIDTSLYRRTPVDFTPGMSHGTIAKLLLTAMLALAALPVLSLAGMALRVWRRVAFGRKSSAALRSVLPVLLGLGGWFLAVLVVLTSLPNVPLDDELLAALSVGLPIGVGIYLAWLNRDWSAGTKATGFAAAAGGALVGAWFGFHATAGLIALVTAIVGATVGATVGANLALVALDIAWDRQARDRYAESGAEETAAPGPSVG
jgi:hypothetical protein